ncbi:hypothetical protein J2045_000558 [Peteryoungia aggregata LMG 23059]|uniref:DUF3618 domain-containing protein n=1 Tax=Peteryoungia aggregata LMG 23059 TaxID=1368425 RepID=A0ABU0G2Q4_9HYPH|nr:hypothetical protein [Peteryoungia aggregata]MDQ0419548.1 hypothetical protein [Peteryoungia aggregata LMG 23059]
MQMNDDRLDELFADLRSIEAAPSDALTARLIADAQSESDRLAATRERLADRPTRFSPRLLVEDILGLIGGWRPALGMAASLCCGIWFGAVGSDPAMFLSGLGLDRPAITVDLPENPSELIATPKGMTE